MNLKICSELCDICCIFEKVDTTEKTILISYSVYFVQKEYFVLNTRVPTGEVIVRFHSEAKLHV